MIECGPVMKKMSNDNVFLCISCFSNKNNSMLQDIIILFLLDYMFIICVLFVVLCLIFTPEQHQNSLMSLQKDMSGHVQYLSPCLQIFRSLGF